MTEEVSIQSVLCKVCAAGILEVICFVNSNSLLLHCKSCGNAVLLALEPLQSLEKPKKNILTD